MPTPLEELLCSPSYTYLFLWYEAVSGWVKQRGYVDVCCRRYCAKCSYFIDMVVFGLDRLTF